MVWSATVRVEFAMEQDSARAAMERLRHAISEFARYIERGDPTLVATKTGVARGSVKVEIVEQGPADC